MNIKIALFWIVIFLPGLVFAKVPDLPDELTAENFNQEYDRVTESYDDIIANTSKLSLRKIRRNKGNSHARLTKKENITRQDYKKLRKQKRILDPIHQFREDLVALYEEHNENASYDKEKLNIEATLLAVGLFDETKVLKKKYKSIFIPIFHNMMIDVGIRKRGACKHWAEDLLEYVRPIQRRFFDAAWGEANAGTFMEHNVAVIIPQGQKFETGILFDPWRTSGRAFWIKVTGDKHYKWTRWLSYGQF